MLEQRRQQYLSLLGIDSYVPRRLLVSAAAPVLLSNEQIALPPIEDSVAIANVGVEAVSQNSAFTDQVDSPHFSPENQEKASPPLSPLSVLDVLSDPVESVAVNTAVDKVMGSTLGGEVGDSQRESVTKAVLPTEVSTSPSKELSFVLSVWRIRDQLLVIDSRQPGAAYPTDRLLQNILRAIGYPLAQLPSSEIIRWPLFVNNNNSKTIEQQNQDAEQACAMVQAYITAQMTKLPFKTLLCMGDSAARFSLNHSPDASAESSPDNCALENNQWNIPVVTTSSLFSMLQEPLLKAAAWSALQKIIVKKENP
ncbi:MAG: hypothetical protein ACJAUP_000333 [Cellvibrionaceae bacterium]|jgi:hypothetical protein